MKSGAFPRTVPKVHRQCAPDCHPGYKGPFIPGKALKRFTTAKRVIPKSGQATDPSLRSG